MIVVRKTESDNVRESRMKFDIIFLFKREKEENMAEMIKRFFASMRCAVPRNVFDMTAGADRSDEVLVYADGVPPQQADAEAIYSDWCAVGNSLLDATMRIPA